MKQTFARSQLFTLVLGGLFIWALANIGLLDLPRLSRGVLNLGIFLKALFPPETSVLPTVALAMAETLQIALVGTLLGFLAALPMALAANPVLFPTTITGPVRLLLAAVRTIPSLLWGIIFVVAVGLGAAAGALGVALYSLGYLGKLLYEVFDGVDVEVIEAVRSAGVGRLQLARYAIIPESANGILSQLLFMFEYNVRASSIMGFVGAGGIGFYLLGYIQMLQYSRLMMALLVTLAVVVIIDQASNLIRRMLVLPAEARSVA